MAAMQAEIIKQIVDGQARVLEAVARASITRAGIRSIVEALNAKHTEIDSRIQLASRRLRPRSRPSRMRSLITELNTKFVTASQESEAKFTELNKNLPSWSVSVRQQ